MPCDVYDVYSHLHKLDKVVLETLVVRRDVGGGGAGSYVVLHATSDICRQLPRLHYFGHVRLALAPQIQI